MVDISVIIPTYNRRQYLEQVLETLARQTYPFARFEVIVVDDGSTDDTRRIIDKDLPYTLRYIKQTNSGDAEARNAGARASSATLLVFLDDDVLVSFDYLARLAAAHPAGSQRIVAANQYRWRTDEMPPLDRYVTSAADSLTEMPFEKVFSNNMSIFRQGYLDLGMMQGLPFPGSSIWCDTDFTYRAYLAGYEFLRSERAACWDRDFAVQDWQGRVRRAEEVAYRAVALFQRQPGLVVHLPMFEDKLPLNWGQDGPLLAAKKIGRAILSRGPLLKLQLELQRRIKKPSRLGRAFSQLILGNYHYRGFRRGMRELGGLLPASQADNSNDSENSR